MLVDKNMKRRYKVRICMEGGRIRGAEWVEGSEQLGRKFDQNRVGGSD